MKNTCETCGWFRPIRPLSQLLTHELGVRDQQIVSQILTIVKDEREVQEQEYLWNLEVRQLGEKDWKINPKMSDYCGLCEQEKIYLLHEVKNYDGDCKDHSSIIEKKKCETCKYLKPGTGPEKDQKALDRYADMQRAAAALGQGGDLGMNEYVQSIGSTKALEAAKTYYNGNFLFDPPEYLSICLKYSTPEVFAPCLIQNQHGSCPSHTEENPPQEKHADTYLTSEEVLRQLDAEWQ
ncbi:MAG: hypothetical protein H0X02_09080 [Nitrosomonas sp.]|nr:hypothetical protein [Nitrosomonas sp.]